MTGIFVLISAIICVASGLYIIAMGKWKELKIKFAAVALSTAVSLVMVSYGMFQHQSLFVCNQDTISCLNRDVCIFLRNIAILLFHIAVGRDAIAYKKGDRRIPQKKENHRRAA